MQNSIGFLTVAIMLFGFGLVILDMLRIDGLFFSSRFLGITIGNQSHRQSFKEVEQRLKLSDGLIVKRIAEELIIVRWNSEGEEDDSYRLVHAAVSNDPFRDRASIVVKANLGAFLFPLGPIPSICYEIFWNHPIGFSTIFSCFFFFGFLGLLLILWNGCSWRAGRELQLKICELAETPEVNGVSACEDSPSQS